MPVEIPNLINLKDTRLNPRIVSAIALIGLSLFAAIGISSSANRSVYVWAANTQLAAGSQITAIDIKKVKVFLPENSKLYYSNRAKIIGSTLLRTVGIDELIPVAAVSPDKSSSDRKSVPLKVARNDYPSDLIKGSIIDVFALPARETNSIAEAKLIAHSVTIENIDLHGKDIGGEIGVVIKLKNENIEGFLTDTIGARLVVVRSAF